MRAAPTARLAALVAVAATPLAFDGRGWLSVALSLLVLAVAVVDLVISRRSFDVVRKPLTVLSLGADNLVEFELRSPGAPVVVELREALPLYLDLVGNWPRATLSGNQWQTASYRLRPSRRGQYTLGPLYGRYQSPLGLWRRLVTWPLAQPVRVYPNLLAARQWEIAIRQGRHLEGLKRTHRRGTGTEFESLREYQEGDQYRSINWPASARLGQLVTTLYQVDRSQPVMLMIDAGRIMLPEVNGLTKLDHSLNAALLLATVAAERGDQCGLMLFGGEVKAFMPPGKGRGQVMNMLETLYDVAPEQVEPDYGRMISWLRAKHKKRSLVVFFTDIIDPDVSKGLIAHLSALAAHHLVLLVCLSDPELLQLSKLEPKDSRQLYQKAAALEVLSQRAETRARLQRQGVLVIDVPPEEFSTAVVNQYLSIKARGRL